MISARAVRGGQESLGFGHSLGRHALPVLNASTHARRKDLTPLTWGWRVRCFISTPLFETKPAHRASRVWMKSKHRPLLNPGPTTASSPGHTQLQGFLARRRTNVHCVRPAAAVVRHDKPPALFFRRDSSLARKCAGRRCELVGGVVLDAVRWRNPITTGTRMRNTRRYGFRGGKRQAGPPQALHHRGLPVHDTSGSRGKPTFLHSQ